MALKYGLRMTYAVAFCGISLCVNSCSGTGSEEPLDASAAEPVTEVPPATEMPPVKAGAVSIDEVVATYEKEFELVTPEPVWVNHDLARRCTGVRVETLRDVEKEHGPHAFSQISISMNDLAADAFKKKSGNYPEGSVIVKVKDLGWVWGGTGNRSMTARAPAEPGKMTGMGVGGMIKRHAGYAPESGDWEYFYFESKDSIEHGLIQSCVQCHRKTKSSDYVFGHWNEPADGGY